MISDIHDIKPQEIRLTVSVGDKDLPNPVFNKTLTNDINLECPNCANSIYKVRLIEPTICYCWDCNDFVTPKERKVI